MTKPTPKLRDLPIPARVIVVTFVTVALVILSLLCAITVLYLADWLLAIYGRVNGS